MGWGSEVTQEPGHLLRQRMSFEVGGQEVDGGGSEMEQF